VLLPGAQGPDQRGFVELRKDSRLTKETLHAIAERRLMAKGTHSNKAVGHAVGKLGRQVLLDRHLSKCRAVGSDIDESGFAPVDNAGDLEIANEGPDRQRDDVVNIACPPAARDVRSGIFSVSGLRPRRSTAWRRGDLSDYGHCPRLAGSHITMPALMVLHATAWAPGQSGGFKGPT